MILRPWLLFLICSPFANPSEQANNLVLPADTAKLIRVQISNGYGLGGSSSTTIEPFFMFNESEGMFKNKHFHRKTKSAITKRDWENLSRAVDAKALASAPQGVCAAISDGPCDSLEVEFSDKTKIDVVYDSRPPAPVSAILQQINLIRQKPFRSGMPFEPLTDSLEPSAAAKLALRERSAFDVPLKKQVIDLGPSPRNQFDHSRIKLSCYFFAKFMVKEIDSGQKGADALAIVIFENEAPPCAQSNAHEIAIEDYGGFKGAKGDFAFFDAPDGTNGGLPFRVYEASKGKIIFEDSASMRNRTAKDSPFDRLRVSSDPDGWITLRYLRVVEADCDLHSETSKCWNRVRKEYAIPQAEAPVCSGYEHVTTRWVSALAYPVEVSLSPAPSRQTVAGPVRCWPVD